MFYKITALVLILWQLFHGCDEALGTSDTHTATKSVSLHLNSSHRECNFDGASLFCRGMTDTKVCHYCANGTAICNSMPNDGMICMEGRVYIRNCYCATYNSQSDSIMFGKCLFNCGRTKYGITDDGYHELPQNISHLNVRMCGVLHRNKTLCGRCKHKHYPMAFSYNMSCIKCPHTEWNWFRLIFFVFVPLSVFCFFILIFNINFNSCYLHGFIFFSQAVSIPAMSRAILIVLNKTKYLTFIKILGSFYSVWNLDIFRSFSPPMCLHINPLDILTLDLIIGLYPLVLVIITHFIISLYDRRYRVIRILWEPFRRSLSRFQSYFEIKTSLIDSFATMFVLANVKFMSVCFDMLASVSVYELSSSSCIRSRFGLFYDATSEVYSNTARAVLTHLVLIVFTISPIVLLLLYPFKFFQKFLNAVPVQWQALHTFVDVFQGGYKNTFDRQRFDFRWFSSLFFIVRLLFIIIYVATLSSVFFSYIAILSVLICMVLILFQPFKREQDNFVNSGYFLLLSLWYVGILGSDLAHSVNVNTLLFFNGFTVAIAILPLVFLSILLLLWIKEHVFKHKL